MSKILIYINDELLDIYEDTEISLVYTPFRFTEDLTEPWSNDFEIPKTPKNLRILGVTDYAFPVQGYLSKQAIVYYGTIVMKSKIEIVAVDDDNISICIFEDRWPSSVWTTELWQVRDDDETTIIPWHKNSIVPVYNPGCQYNTDDIQLHPSLAVNEIFNSASQSLNFDFGQPPLSHDSMIVCSQKTVTPHNKKQNLMFLGDSNSSYLKHMSVTGGQQICNDVEGWDGLTNPWESSQTLITFNRNCKWVINGMILSYFNDFPNNSLNKVCRVVKNHGSQAEQELLRFFIYKSPISKYDYWENQNITFDIQENDTISVIPEVNEGDLKGICLTLLAEIQDYTVTDDDYGRELIYCPKNAFTIKTYPFEEYGTPEPLIAYLNGERFITRTYHNNLIDYDINSVTPPTEYVSFFGKYTNLPKTTLSKFILNLQRLWNSAVYYNNNDMAPGCVWRGLDQNLSETIYDLPKHNETKNLATDKVNYKNIIKDINGNVFTQWTLPSLKNSNNKEIKTIFESDILYPGNQRVAKWDQYSVDIELVREVVDEDNFRFGSELKYTFENIDGVMMGILVITEDTRTKPYITPINRSLTCDMDRVMPVEISFEVPVQTFTNAGLQDIIYIDGYTYLVTEIIIEENYVSVSAVLTDTDSRKFNDF